MNKEDRGMSRESHENFMVRKLNKIEDGLKKVIEHI